MKKTTSNFNEWLRESDEFDQDEVSRMRELGLDEMEADEAWEAMTDEFYADPEVEAAVKLLHEKYEKYWNKYSRDEFEEEWQRYQEWMWEEKLDEIGIWGWLSVN